MAANTITLSKRTIDSLKPGAERFDVFDKSLRGFSLRVHPSGRKSFRFKYVHCSRQRVITIGEYGAPWTAESARIQAQKMRGLVAAGVDPAEQRKPERSQAKSTLAEVIERWLSEGRAAAPNKRDSSWANDASRLRRHIVPLLGARPAESLRRAEIEAAQRDIAAGATAADVRTGPRGRARIRGGAAVARGAIVSLSACLSWAVSAGLIAANPAAKVKKFAAEKRERFLSDAEMARLLDAIAELKAKGTVRPAFGDALVLLLLTGARKSEIARLTWAEVDLDRALINLPRLRAKAGAKSIVLSAPALELVAAQPRVSPFVFPSPRDPSKSIVGIQKVWQQVRRAAKLEGVRVHDLRHSFASAAAADGASLISIAKVLGHAQVSTTARYSHLADGAARAVADGVGARISAAASRPRSASASGPPLTSAARSADQ